MVALSIITINLNNAAGLRKTIESVAGQSFTGFEFIVIDGGSTDDSRQIMDSYSHRIDCWVSEPDEGIYQAMNKGIKLAKGEYCLFLNSGDWLAETGILRHVFDTNPQADIVAGDVYYYDTVKDVIKWMVPSPGECTAKTFFSGTLPHQATFIRRRLFELIGLYNEHLKVASDWLFFVEALLVQNCTYQHHEGVVSFFNIDGISCNPETSTVHEQEKCRALQQKYPRFLADYQRLELLEKQHQQWTKSREYRVHGYLERLGIIRLGMFCLRAKRLVLKRGYNKF